MRRFNPDKELNKIRKGNKNKILYSVITLLLIVAVGSTYALYQVRHTNKLVFNTVSEFKKRDIYLSVLVNGKTQNEFPNQEDGYAFSGYECDGDATVTFDPDEWMASVNSNGPDKCTIKFGPKNINYDIIRQNEDVIVDETTDANLRFVGPNPSNYIWFNCLKYDDLTNENAEDEEHKCEKWQIIGLMNNMTIVNEETEEETHNQSLVKIRRADSIGKLSWDNKDTTTGSNDDYGSNDWSTARLMKLLNPGYESEKIGGSLYWNSQDGECYSDKNNATIPCDFRETGLKNDNTKNMIENVKWNIAGVKSYGSYTTLSLYFGERGTVTWNNQPSTWNGKIALMYPSDYGYATSGLASSNTTNREACLNQILKNWENEDYKFNCAQNSWLFDTTTSQWTLMQHPAFSRDVISISSEFSLGLPFVCSTLPTKPTLYLTHDTKVTGGNGTYDNPYTINVN